MASSYPTSLDSFTNPSSGDTLDSPSHSGQHADKNDAIEALQTKVGIGASAAASASTDQILTKQADGTTAWADKDTSVVPGYASTWWYSPSYRSSKSTVTMGEGTPLLSPFEVSEETLFDRIGAAITSAGTAGAVVRLGIYAAGSNGLPGDLVLDAGTIDGTSATVQEIVISETLAAGWYWLIAATQGSASTRPTLRAIQGSMPNSIAKTSGVALDAAVYSGVYQTGITGALPASLGTPGGMTNIAAQVALRAA